MTSSAGNAVSSDRDRRIDALRGVCALAVVLHHLNAVPRDPAVELNALWRALTDYGYLGVPAFFVLSGFCIGHSWLQSPGPIAFMRRRFWRIYPAYFVSLVLIITGATAWKLINGTNDVVTVPRSIVHLISALALVTQPASRFDTANWVYWSLTYEVFFYFAIGGLLWFSRARARALAWLHFFLSGLDLLRLDLRETPLFFVDHWNIFALGLAACLIATRSSEAWRFSLVSAMALLGRMAQDRFGGFETVSIVIFLVIMLPRRWLLPTERNPLVGVGKISYSVYLVHVPVGVFLFQRLTAPFITSSPWRYALLHAAALAFVLGAAAALYHSIEKWGIALGRTAGAPQPDSLAPALSAIGAPTSNASNQLSR